MRDNKLVAAEIVSAYVSNNSLPASELPNLIRSVVTALDNLGKAEDTAEPAPKPEPPVPIKKSVQREYLISLEDGKRYKTLTRHLAALGLTPDAYRAKWDLPRDYPMVAQAYSQARSEQAKGRSFGRRATTGPVETPGTSEPAASTIEDEPTVEEPVDAAEMAQEAA